MPQLLHRCREVVIPPIYEAGGNFRNGLALVESGGKQAYIDRTGSVIWMNAVSDE